MVVFEARVEREAQRAVLVATERIQKPGVDDLTRRRLPNPHRAVALQDVDVLVAIDVDLHRVVQVHRHPYALKVGLERHQVRVVLLVDRNRLLARAALRIATQPGRAAIRCCRAGRPVAAVLRSPAAVRDARAVADPRAAAAVLWNGRQIVAAGVNQARRGEQQDQAGASRLIRHRKPQKLTWNTRPLQAIGRPRWGSWSQAAATWKNHAQGLPADRPRSLVKTQHLSKNLTRFLH